MVTVRVIVYWVTTPAIELTGTIVTGILLRVLTFISILVRDETYSTPLFRMFKATKLKVPKVIGERMDRDITKELFLAIDCWVMKEKLLLELTCTELARVAVAPFTRRG
jgi:hypothetical protein